VPRKRKADKGRGSSAISGLAFDIAIQEFASAYKLRYKKSIKSKDAIAKYKEWLNHSSILEIEQIVLTACLDAEKLCDQSNDDKDGSNRQRFYGLVEDALKNKLIGLMRLSGRPRRRRGLVRRIRSRASRSKTRRRDEDSEFLSTILAIKKGIWAKLNDEKMSLLRVNEMIERFPGLIEEVDAVHDAKAIRVYLKFRGIESTHNDREELRHRKRYSRLIRR